MLAYKPKHTKLHLTSAIWSAFKFLAGSVCIGNCPLCSNVACFVVSGSGSLPLSAPDAPKDWTLAGPSLWSSCRKLETLGHRTPNFSLSHPDRPHSGATASCGRLLKVKLGSNGSETRSCFPRKLLPCCSQTRLFAVGIFLPFGRSRQVHLGGLGNALLCIPAELGITPLFSEAGAPRLVRCSSVPC